MASNKRASSHEEGNDDRDRQAPGKRRYGPSELQDTRAAAGGNSTNDMALSLEPLLRKVVQEMIPPILEEVIPPILQRYLSPCRGLSLNRQIAPSRDEGRALQLCFMNRLPSTMFTMSKITAEDGSPLQIALCDTTFQHPKVKEDGPSMKIQICVLKGDFGSNGSEDWTAEEFNANILSQREGKPPLLKGDTVVTLKNGVGYFENVEFTDNCRWTRSGKFRIGVKVWHSTFIGANIKEGRSEPIRVKDKRGLTNEKPDRPSLNDKVWRLHKIGKNGPIHRQLSSNGIKTVKDLLLLYTTNQGSLPQKIGNIPGRAWEKIIGHAKACEIDDDKRYIYQYFAAEQAISLVFNCIYQVVEVSFNGQNFCSLESLNLEEERLVEIVKRQAYNNLEDLEPIEPTPHSLVGTLAAVQFGAPDQGLRQFDLPIVRQGQPQILPNFSQPSTSTTSYIDEAAHSDQVGCSHLPDQLVEQLISGTWPISGSQIDQFASYSLPPVPWEPVDFYCRPCDYGAESSNPFPNSAVYISSKGKRKTVWNKIRNALKWVILHAAKKKEKVFGCQY